ncbi:helix-turn-helix domain-containing protein [Amycolatopsis sp. H20-H5]|uniref:helix-turn-helix domain-containing protein n=1 Tax=Amycolatopsis sp. H20-H5 TaxID=3046309 RepID=UPI002DB7DC67|nr:helix-turn-helix domain-containing protein [Amycolatopsis sp. H20-H5]MEC3976564.1 helix-turn-helix domain-containing protein [Amycolatopsis sp. H20-H5]
MHSAEQIAQVTKLRQLGRSPKEIARELGIKPAEAARLVRAAAASQAPAEAQLAGCWISPGWSTGLTVDTQSGLPTDSSENTTADGMVMVLVARHHRYDKILVCGYLVDTYCLGVKNVFGPEVMDDRELPKFVPHYFKAYDAAPLEAPIELAREVVLGAIDYARTLGFEPHEDFPHVEAHLGPWTGPSAITFGKEGRPFYVNGPHDHSLAILSTLKRTAGAGNFDTIMNL